MANAVPFVSLLKRAKFCRFGSVVMVNRLFMQCYTVEIDADVGNHYILFFPDTPEYEDPFFDETLILEPASALQTYNDGHGLLESRRKSEKAKPKEASEEVVLVKETGVLKFLYYLRDELLTVRECKVEYPVNPQSPVIRNCEESYSAVLERVKPGGACYRFDGLRIGIFDEIMETPDVFSFPIRHRGRTISVPFTRSTFLGLRKLDSFQFSVQETLIPNVYLFAVQFSRNGILEETFGYLMDYD